MGADRYRPPPWFVADNPREKRHDLSYLVLNTSCGRHMNGYALLNNPNCFYRPLYPAPSSSSENQAAADARAHGKGLLDNYFNYTKLMSKLSMVPSHHGHSKTEPIQGSLSEECTPRGLSLNSFLKGGQMRVLKSWNSGTTKHERGLYAQQRATTGND